MIDVGCPLKANLIKMKTTQILVVERVLSALITNHCMNQLNRNQAINHGMEKPQKSLVALAM